MLYGWPLRPPFVVTGNEGYHYLVYVALTWLLGQFVLLIFQPLLYALHRLICRETPSGATAAGHAPQMGRREFMHNALAAIPVLAFGVSAEGVYSAQRDMTGRMAPDFYCWNALFA